MAVRRTTVTATASAGGAGTATGDARSQHIVQGAILAVYLDYSAASAATMDVVINEANNSPALPVLTVTNTATDGWYYPRITVDNVADGSDLTGPADYQHVADYLKLALAQGNVNDSVTATIVWDDLT